MGRPHTPLLDRDRIADAALRLTDRRGDFTILDLARALKVTPAAIYHHVDGRAEIVTLLRQQMARTVDASAFGQLPWDQALRCWATSYRETFAAPRRRHRYAGRRTHRRPRRARPVRTSGHRPGRRGLPPPHGARGDHRGGELRPGLRAQPRRPARHGHRHRRRRHSPARRGGRRRARPGAPGPTRPSTSAWTPSSPASTTRSAKRTATDDARLDAPRADQLSLRPVARPGIVRGPEDRIMLCVDRIAIRSTPT